MSLDEKVKQDLRNEIAEVTQEGQKIAKLLKTAAKFIKEYDEWNDSEYGPSDTDVKRFRKKLQGLGFEE